MGVIMYGLLDGRFPFKDENDIKKKDACSVDLCQVVPGPRPIGRPHKTDCYFRQGDRA